MRVSKKNVLLEHGEMKTLSYLGGCTGLHQGGWGVKFCEGKKNEGSTTQFLILIGIDTPLPTELLILIIQISSFIFPMY